MAIRMSEDQKQQHHVRGQCSTCSTLERWSPEDLEPGRKKPIRRQVWEEGTRADPDGTTHECAYATCEDCDTETCECDGSVCEACDAHLCDDCRVYTNDGHFCEYCCVSGYSYAAVTAMTESNYRLRKALQAVVDGYAAGDNPRWLAPALAELNVAEGYLDD